MTRKYIASLYLFCLFSFSCSNPTAIEIKNPRKGQLKNTIALDQTGTKKFKLDSITAPKPIYTQIYTNSAKRYFTFLNKYNNSIYFYDYEKSFYIKKIPLGRKADNKAVNILGYYIKTIDSIYTYNKLGLNVLVANQKGFFFKKISLLGNMNAKKRDWVYRYPQYNPQTAIPFIISKEGLVLPGQFLFSLPDSVINKFTIMSYIDFKQDKVTHYHNYPRLLYGNNYNWYGKAFQEVYADLSSDGNKIVLSFPISHDLYIADLKSNLYKTVYGGSNTAETITSINSKPNQVSNEMQAIKFVATNEYAAIKYDRYRKVYYRFFRSAIPNASSAALAGEKKISVIVFDKNFKYLGETSIGKQENWNIRNVFITKEGLNIEYKEKDTDENYLVLKIFTLKTII